MNPPRGDRIARLARRAAAVVFLGAWVNFMWFAAGVFVFGGHALNRGTVVNGRYYFDNNGTPTPVSRFVWNYSYVHAVSVCVTQPLGIFGAAALAAYARRREKRLNEAGAGEQPT